jgi:predicted HAD superfamily Cof-like phosphohydrolase
MSPAALVAQFHRQFGMPHRTSPIEGLPDAEVDLRVALLEEEVREVVGAARACDLPELGHELADVVYATTLVRGVDLDAVVAEVHLANMTKQRRPVRQDDLSGRPQAWKSVKGIGYTPPDISAVLGIQGCTGRRPQGSEG